MTLSLLTLLLYFYEKEITISSIFISFKKFSHDIITPNFSCYIFYEKKQYHNFSYHVRICLMTSENTTNACVN